MSLSTLNDLDIDEQEHYRTAAATVTPHSEWEPTIFSLLVGSFNFVAAAATAVRTIVPYNRVWVRLLVLANYGAGTWEETLRFGCKIAEVGWRGVVRLNRAAREQNIPSWLSVLGRRGAIRFSVKALKRLRGPRSVPRPLRINIAAVTWERAVFDHQGLSRFELQTPNFASARSGQLFFADADRDIRTAQFNRQAQLGHVIPTAAQDFGVAAHIKGEVDE
ncbi:hypothetical protein AAVH_13459 [Aphelenchoides avenae]|nr:hypothetical protein AAVH_13459 [Aphelenchus avenae]